MPDYSNGKIYCIRSPHTEEVYIGSTTQALAKRIGCHRQEFKLWKIGKTGFVTSFKLIELGDSYIELIEEYPCQNKEQLNKREGEIIRQTEKCVNKIIAGRTKQEYYIENRDYINDKNKLYHDVNKEAIHKQRKAYRDANKELIREQKKVYRQKYHKEIKEKKKMYYDKNKDEINARRRLRANEKKERNKINDNIIDDQAYI